MRRSLVGVTLLMAGEISGAGVAAPTDLASQRQRLQLEQSSVAAHIDRRTGMLDNSAAARQAVSCEQSLAESIVVQVLNTGGGSGDLLKTVGDIADEAVFLDPETLLVVAPLPDAGFVFVVRRERDGYHLVWDTRQISRSEVVKYPLLAAWWPKNAGPGCNAKGDLECGPLSPSAGRLPDDRQGRARFYVDAWYSELQGSLPYQLSVWIWDGDRARPLVVQNYFASMESGRELHVRGDLLQLRVMDQFRSFYACGECDGRQVLWTLRLIPDGIRDLGKKGLDPGLEAIDELFDRMLHERSTAGIAAPSVVDFLKPNVRSELAEWQRINASETLEMLDDSVITHRGNLTTVCFSTDRVGYFLFTLMPKASGYFISSVRQLADLSAHEDPCTRRKFK